MTNLLRCLCFISIVGLSMGAAAPSAKTPSTTQASTRPATRPNPLREPDLAVQRFFDLLRREDFSNARLISLHSITSSELREAMAKMIAGFHEGKKPVIVDVHRAGNVAIVECQIMSARGEKEFAFGLITVQRYDDWKIQIGPPNPLKLTEGERNYFAEVAARLEQRVAERKVEAESGAKP